MDKTGLLSWRANKYSAPMAYQGSRVGVCAEAGELVLLDLETGREIARHVIAQDKGSHPQQRPLPRQGGTGRRPGGHHR